VSMILNKEKVMKRKLSVSLIFLIFILGACAYNASFVKTSYDILAISQTSYDTSMKVVVDLDKRNILLGNDKIKILAVATIFYQTHNSAVEALAKYEETKSSVDQELLEKQITLVSEAISNLLTIIRPYLEE